MRTVGKKKNNKKILYTALSILAMLIISSGIVYSFLTPHNNSAVPDKTNPAQEQKSGADQKSDTINSDKNNPSTTPPTPQSDNIKLSTSIDASNNVIVTTRLYQISDGTCKLSVTYQNETAGYIAPVIYQSEYSTCAGFSIPTNNRPGTWKMSLTVTSNGVSASKETTVNLP